jgi:8-oxo-dGTP pyrophosphatase MutT (NUDIX family)
LIPKVLTYITHAGRLLVFRQPHAPSQGTQVPGGSVEPNETFEVAALREAREETGIEGLVFQAYLGSALYELQVDIGPPHFRHFVHLSATGNPAARWQHSEAPTLTRSETVQRELWWEPLPALTRRLLDWQMDAFLPQLEQRLKSSR